MTLQGLVEELVSVDKYGAKIQAQVDANRKRRDNIRNEIKQLLIKDTDGSHQEREFVVTLDNCHLPPRTFIITLHWKYVGQEWYSDIYVRAATDLTA